MEIELTNGIKVKLNEKDHTSSVIKSPKANGNIIIPKFAEYNNVQYPIVSINQNAFNNQKIESISFPDDSEVISFQNVCFYSIYIKKLQIPAKLKHFYGTPIYNVKDLLNIEVSPKNTNFVYFEDKFLLSKSDEKTDIFDILLYARYDIEEASIPPQVKIIKSQSFYLHPKLKSIIFPENSEIKIIENSVFDDTPIERINVPASLEEIDPTNFDDVKKLTNIEISPKNNFFSLFDNKFIVKKSNRNNSNFDQIVFCFKDIEEIEIPSHIKEIGRNSFNKHYNLKSLKFQPNSSLEIIDDNAFLCCKNLTKIIIPEKVRNVNSMAFFLNENLTSIIFLSRKIVLGSSCISSCKKIEEISFPNAIEIIFDDYSQNIRKEAKIFVRKDAKIEGQGASIYKSQINFIEDENIKIVEDENNNITANERRIKDDDKSENEYNENRSKNDNVNNINENNINRDTNDNVNKNKNDENDENRSKNDNDINENSINGDTNENVNKKKNDDANDTKKAIKNEKKKLDNKGHLKTDNENEFKKRIELLEERNRYLKSRLSQYEKVDSFNETQCNLNESKNEFNYFIGEDDEKFHNVIEKIGEGATSVAYKVIDKRNKRVMCKKILKTDEKQYSFEKIQNSVKEFEILINQSHPCICKAIGLNLQEKVQNYMKNQNENENKNEFPVYEYESDSEDENKQQQNQHQHQQEENKNKKNESNKTVALFMEFLPYKLKDFLESSMINNTLKVRIAVEVAFGMYHIHKNGMMHRDLKIENIMLNYAFEAKIIDFDLAHVQTDKNENQSLTKGIGTLAYMSPEMSSEEEYDNKTDVYSYGIVLFAIFTGRLPKQTLKEKMTNSKPIRFPHSSSSISKYCIELIQKCVQYEPNKRPSFDEIIENMKENSFALADEVDTEIINRRYETLKRHI